MNSIEETLDQIRKYTLIGVKNVLTVEEAAIYTGYSRDTIYQFISEGTIPCSRHEDRKRCYFLKADLDAWMMQTERPEKVGAAQYVHLGRGKSEFRPVRSKRGRPRKSEA